MILLEYGDLRSRMEQALEQALDVYHRDKEYEGSNPVSRAFDAGRVDGLKQALELLEKTGL